MEAKRANEQIKSLSTAINALAAGSAVAVTAKQLSEPTPDYPLVIIAIGLGVWIHTGARHLLGLLKDESISATRPLKSPPRKLAAVWMRYNLPNGTHCAAAPHPAQRGNRTIAFSVAGGVRRNFSGKQHPLSQ